jgi:hypothetical protein
MPKPIHAALAAAALVVLGGAALAQPAPVPAPVPDRPPTATPPENRVPEQLAPRVPEAGAEAAQPGVISPRRNLDPDMAVRPPRVDPNSPSVIPPPGTPGGNPTVQPR